MNNSLVTKLRLIAQLFCLVSFAYNILCAHIDEERGHPVKNSSSHQYLVANYSSKGVPTKPRFQCDFTGQCFTVWVLEPPCSNGYLEPKAFRPGYLKVSLRGSNLCTNSSSTISLSWFWGSIKTGDSREIRRCREMWTCMIPFKAILPSKLEPRWLDVAVSTNKNVTENSTQMDLPITISVRSKLLGKKEKTQNSESKPVKDIETELDLSKNKDETHYSEKLDEKQLYKETDISESIKPLPFLLQTKYANAHDKIGGNFPSRQVSTSKEGIKLLLQPSFYRSPPSNTNINFNESLNIHNLRKLTEKSQIQNNSQIDIIRHNYKDVSNKENIPHMKIDLKSLPKEQKSSNSYLKFDSQDIKVNSSKKSDNSPSGSTQAVFLPLQRRLNNLKGPEFPELKRRLNNSKFMQLELRAPRSIRHVDEDEAVDIAILMSAESKEDRNKIASMIASDFESTAGLSNPVISRNHWRGGSASTIGRAEDHGLRDMNRLINVIEDEEDKVASNLPLGEGDQEDLLVEIGSEAHLTKLRHQIKKKKRKLEHAKVALNNANLRSLQANAGDLGGAVPGEVIVEKNELKKTVSDLESSLQRLRDQYSDLIQEKEDYPGEKRKLNGVVTIDPVWSLWSSWSSCSHDCSQGGYSVRRRSCDTMPSVPCPGSNFDMRMCNEQACEGHWVTWGSWGPCTVSCGTGARARSRVCVGGSSESTANCPGHSTQSVACDLVPCSTYNDANSNLVPPESKHKKVVVIKPKEETLPAKHKPKPKPEPKAKPTKKPLVIRKPAKTRHQNRERGRGKREAVQSHITIHSDPVLLAREATHKSRRRWRSKRRAMGMMRSRSGPLMVPKRYRDHKPPLFHPFMWGVWGEWSACSVACGEGVRRKQRICINFRNMDAKRAADARCKPGPAEVQMKCVGEKCGNPPDDSEAEASAAAASTSAAAVGDGDDNEDLLSDDEASFVSDADPWLVAGGAGGASVAENGFYEAMNREAAARERAAAEEDEEEEQLIPETIIFVVLLCLLLVLLIIAFCIWFSSRYQEAKMKHELAEALPFYNTNQDLDDLGDEGGMFDSKSRGVVKPVIRNPKASDDQASDSSKKNIKRHGDSSSAEEDDKKKKKKKKGGLFKSLFGGKKKGEEEQVGFVFDENKFPSEVIMDMYRKKRKHRKRKGKLSKSSAKLDLSGAGDVTLSVSGTSVNSDVEEERVNLNDRLRRLNFERITGTVDKQGEKKRRFKKPRTDRKLPVRYQNQTSIRTVVDASSSDSETDRYKLVRKSRSFPDILGSRSQRSDTDRHSSTSLTFSSKTSEPTVRSSVSDALLHKRKGYGQRDQHKPQAKQRYPERHKRGRGGKDGKKVKSSRSKKFPRSAGRLKAAEEPVRVSEGHLHILTNPHYNQVIPVRSVVSSVVTEGSSRVQIKPGPGSTPGRSLEKDSTVSFSRKDAEDKQKRETGQNGDESSELDALSRTRRLRKWLRGKDASLSESSSQHLSGRRSPRGSASSSIWLTSLLSETDLKLKDIDREIDQVLSQVCSHSAVTDWSSESLGFEGGTVNSSTTDFTESVGVNSREKSSTSEQSGNAEESNMSDNVKKDSHKPQSKAVRGKFSSESDKSEKDSTKSSTAQTSLSEPTHSAKNESSVVKTTTSSITDDKSKSKTKKRKEKNKAQHTESSDPSENLSEAATDSEQKTEDFGTMLEDQSTNTGSSDKRTSSSVAEQGNTEDDVEDEDLIEFDVTDVSESLGDEGSHKESSQYTDMTSDPHENCSESVHESSEVHRVKSVKKKKQQKDSKSIEQGENSDPKRLESKAVKLSRVRKPLKDSVSTEMEETSRTESLENKPKKPRKAKEKLKDSELAASEGISQLQSSSSKTTKSTETQEQQKYSSSHSKSSPSQEVETSESKKQRQDSQESTYSVNITRPVQTHPKKFRDARKSRESETQTLNTKNKKCQSGETRRKSGSIQLSKDSGSSLTTDKSHEESIVIEGLNAEAQTTMQGSSEATKTITYTEKTRESAMQTSAAAKPKEKTTRATAMSRSSSVEERSVGISVQEMSKLDPTQQPSDIATDNLELPATDRPASSDRWPSYEDKKNQVLRMFDTKHRAFPIYQPLMLHGNRNQMYSLPALSPTQVPHPTTLSELSSAETLNNSSGQSWSSSNPVQSTRIAESQFQAEDIGLKRAKKQTGEAGRSTPGIHRGVVESVTPWQSSSHRYGRGCFKIHQKSWGTESADQGMRLEALPYKASDILFQDLDSQASETVDKGMGSQEPTGMSPNSQTQSAHLEKKAKDSQMRPFSTQSNSQPCQSDRLGTSAQTKASTQSPISNKASDQKFEDHSKQRVVSMPSTVQKPTRQLSRTAPDKSKSFPAPTKSKEGRGKPVGCCSEPPSTLDLLWQSERSKELEKSRPENNSETDKSDRHSSITTKGLSSKSKSLTKGNDGIQSHSQQLSTLQNSRIGQSTFPLQAKCTELHSDPKTYPFVTDKTTTAQNAKSIKLKKPNALESQFFTTLNKELSTFVDTAGWTSSKSPSQIRIDWDKCSDERKRRQQEKLKKVVVSENHHAALAQRQSQVRKNVTYLLMEGNQGLPGGEILDERDDLLSDLVSFPQQQSHSKWRYQTQSLTNLGEKGDIYPDIYHGSQHHSLCETFKQKHPKSAYASKTQPTGGYTSQHMHSSSLGEKSQSQSTSHQTHTSMSSSQKLRVGSRSIAHASPRKRIAKLSAPFSELDLSPGATESSYSTGKEDTASLDSWTSAPTCESQRPRCSHPQSSFGDSSMTHSFSGPHPHQLTSSAVILSPSKVKEFIEDEKTQTTKKQARPTLTKTPASIASYKTCGKPVTSFPQLNQSYEAGQDTIMSAEQLSNFRTGRRPETQFNTPGIGIIPSDIELSTSRTSCASSSVGDFLSAPSQGEVSGQDSWTSVKLEPEDNESLAANEKQDSDVREWHSDNTSPKLQHDVNFEQASSVGTKYKSLDGKDCLSDICIASNSGASTRFMSDSGTDNVVEKGQACMTNEQKVSLFLTDVQRRHDFPPDLGTEYGSDKGTNYKSDIGTEFGSDFGSNIRPEEAITGIAENQFDLKKCSPSASIEKDMSYSVRDLASPLDHPGNTQNHEDINSEPDGSKKLIRSYERAGKIEKGQTDLSEERAGDSEIEQATYTKSESYTDNKKSEEEADVLRVLSYLSSEHSSWSAGSVNFPLSSLGSKSGTPSPSVQSENVSGLVVIGTEAKEKDGDILRHEDDTGSHKQLYDSPEIPRPSVQSENFSGLRMFAKGAEEEDGEKLGHEDGSGIQAQVCDSIEIPCPPEQSKNVSGSEWMGINVEKGGDQIFGYENETGIQQQGCDSMEIPCPSMQAENVSGFLQVGEKVVEDGGKVSRYEDDTLIQQEGCERLPRISSLCDPQKSRRQEPMVPQALSEGNLKLSGLPPLVSLVRGGGSEHVLHSSTPRELPSVTSEWLTYPTVQRAGVETGDEMLTETAAHTPVSSNVGEIAHTALVNKHNEEYQYFEAEKSKRTPEGTPRQLLFGASSPSLPTWSDMDYTIAVFPGPLDISVQSQTDPSTAPVTELSDTHNSSATGVVDSKESLHNSNDFLNDVRRDEEAKLAGQMENSKNTSNSKYLLNGEGMDKESKTMSDAMALVEPEKQVNVRDGAMIPSLHQSGDDTQEPAASKPNLPVSSTKSRSFTEFCDRLDKIIEAPPGEEHQDQAVDNSPVQDFSPPPPPQQPDACNNHETSQSTERVEENSWLRQEQHPLSFNQQRESQSCLQQASLLPLSLISKHYLIKGQKQDHQSNLMRDFMCSWDDLPQQAKSSHRESSKCSLEIMKSGDPSYVKFQTKSLSSRLSNWASKNKTRESCQVVNPSIKLSDVHKDFNKVSKDSQKATQAVDDVGKVTSEQFGSKVDELGGREEEVSDLIDLESLTELKPKDFSQPLKHAHPQNSHLERELERENNVNSINSRPRITNYEQYQGNLTISLKTGKHDNNNDLLNLPVESVPTPDQQNRNFNLSRDPTLATPSVNLIKHMKSSLSKSPKGQTKSVRFEHVIEKQTPKAATEGETQTLHKHFELKQTPDLSHQLKATLPTMSLQSSLYQQSTSDDAGVGDSFESPVSSVDQRFLETSPPQDNVGPASPNNLDNSFEFSLTSMVTLDPGNADDTSDISDHSGSGRSRQRLVYYKTFQDDLDRPSGTMADSGSLQSSPKVTNLPVKISCGSSAFSSVQSEKPLSSLNSSSSSHADCEYSSGDAETRHSDTLLTGVVVNRMKRHRVDRQKLQQALLNSGKSTKSSTSSSVKSKSSLPNSEDNRSSPNKHDHSKFVTLKSVTLSSQGADHQDNHSTGSSDRVIPEKVTNCPQLATAAQNDFHSNLHANSVLNRHDMTSTSTDCSPTSDSNVESACSNLAFSNISGQNCSSPPESSSPELGYYTGVQRGIKEAENNEQSDSSNSGKRVSRTRSAFTSHHRNYVPSYPDSSLSRPGYHLDSADDHHPQSHYSDLDAKPSRSLDPIEDQTPQVHIYKRHILPLPQESSGSALGSSLEVLYSVSQDHQQNKTEFDDREQEKKIAFQGEAHYLHQKDSGDNDMQSVPNAPDLTNPHSTNIFYKMAHPDFPAFQRKPIITRYSNQERDLTPSSSEASGSHQGPTIYQSFLPHSMSLQSQSFHTHLEPGFSRDQAPRDVTVTGRPGSDRSGQSQDRNENRLNIHSHRRNKSHSKREG